MKGIVIKILIADDHFVVREGLKKIFEKTPHFKVVCEAQDGREVLDKIDETDYDIVLLDINMPGPHWLEVLKEIKIKKPRLPVIILSMLKEEEYIIRALKGGASGYLTKESLTDELISAVNKVVQGGRYVSSSVAEKILFYLDEDKETPLHRSLSDREYEVFCSLVQGKKIREIARELFLSPNTVSTYQSRILEKTGMKNIPELVKYAIKHKLVE
jgi:DNA-binding NarL/FixJ family response regulator